MTQSAHPRSPLNRLCCLQLETPQIQIKSAAANPKEGTFRRCVPLSLSVLLGFVVHIDSLVGQSEGARSSPVPP